jgi:regulator of sigma E protease
MSIFWAILLLGILIFVHELGHFLVAKLTGVKVMAFSLGFGPKLIGFKKGETEYKICAVPLGGYVKLLGQESSEDIPPAVWSLDPDAPAYAAGLRVGDQIIAANDIEVLSWTDLRDEWLVGKGKQVRLTVLRKQNRFEFSLPRLNEEPPEEIIRDDEPKAVRFPDLGLTVGNDPVEEARAFFRKPLWARFAVVAAGPLASLLFPVLIYFVYYLSVTEMTSSRIGQVIAQTPAAEAGLLPGDRIVAINGQATPYWTSMSEIIQESSDKKLDLKVERDDQTLTIPVVPEAGESTNMLGDRVQAGRLGIMSTTIPAIIGTGGENSPAYKAGLRLGDVVTAVSGQPIQYIWQLEDLLEEVRTSGRSIAVEYTRPAQEEGGKAEKKIAQLTPEPSVDGSGYEVGLYSADTFVGELKPDEPAALAGIQQGDRIVSVNGKGLSAWLVLTQALREAVHREDGNTRIDPVQIGLVRNGEPLTVSVTQTEEIIKGEFQEDIPRYHFGAYSAVRPQDWLEGEYVPVEGRFGFAAIGSVKTSWEITVMTLQVFYKLLTGQLSVKMLGGPIMIFDVAGKAAERGWQYYIWVMALISINLGLLNLLPVPVLDGGHLMFFTIEGLIRRPLNQRLKERATMVGFAMLMMLMVLVMKNDIERYWDVFFG